MSAVIIYVLLFFCSLKQLPMACSFEQPEQCKCNSGTILSIGDLPSLCCQNADYLPCSYWQSLFEPNLTSITLGEGSMGRVTVLTHPTDGHFYVVKSFFPAAEESIPHFAFAVQHEFTTSSELASKASVAQTYALLTNEQGVHTISEYLPLALPKILPVVDEADTACILRMLAQAVYDLHRHGIAHRDIKPDNIGLSGSGQLKLFDLSEAHPFRQKDPAWSATCKVMAYDFVGTPPYLAPELYDTNANGYDTELADVFSLGMVMFEMIYGYLPWMESRPGDEEFDEIQAKWSQMPAQADQLWELVRALLSIEPEDRPSLEQIMNETYLHADWCQYDEGLGLHVSVEVQ